MALSMKKPSEENAPQAAAEDTAAKATAQAAVAAASEAVDPNLGSMSDKIALVAPLGDPSREDRTPRDVGGKTEVLVTSTIVGFLFKALADMDVPECGLGEDAKSNPMSFKDMTGVRHVKAGETFALTRFETGLLLSQAAFNAKISGEGRNFVVVYQKGTTAGAPKGADGSAAKVSAMKLPTVSLRGVETSIKDLKMIDVLTFTSQPSADGKSRVITSKTIVKGYEKWEPLTRATVRKPSTSAGISDKNVRNKSAAAFLAMVNNKRG